MKDEQSRIVVGLTGGIGSGKSAATRIFSGLGVTVVDADLIARLVVEPGSPALQEIADHFGKSILLTDGRLDRTALRERIFSDTKEKTWLENLLHPLIRQEIIARLHAAESDYVILSSPLLLETGQDALTDRILVIDASEQQQIERTRTRDKISDDAVQKIMATQWSRNQRLSRADDVIVNDSDLGKLATEIRRLHNRYCREYAK